MGVLAPRFGYSWVLQALAVQHSELVLDVDIETFLLVPFAHKTLYETARLSRGKENSKLKSIREYKFARQGAYRQRRVYA